MADPYWQVQDPNSLPLFPGMFQSLYGNFNIGANKTTDTGCNFNNSFSGQVQLSGANDGANLTLRMIERLTRVYSGTMQANGFYNASGTGNLNGYEYSGRIYGVVTGNTIAGFETLDFTSGCPGKQVVYQFNGNK